MSSSPMDWTPELVRERLEGLEQQLEVDRPSEISATHQAYRDAAAVLSSFEPATLRPLGLIEPAEGAPPELLADSILLSDADNRPRWTLRREIRREALQSLAHRGALKAALQANPDRPVDTLQRMLEAYILGTAPPVEQQTLDQLSGTLHITEWLEGLIDGLPERNWVKDRFDFQNLLQPFRSLAGTHFYGRRAELERLRDYVGGPPPDSLRSRLRRHVREVVGLVERPPLLVRGPGGEGKSSLIGRFILEHAELEEPDRLAFVYLDFDRPVLVAEEPLTLLVEALRQLGAQYPQSRERCEVARQELLPLLSAPDGKRGLSDATTELTQTGTVREGPTKRALDLLEEVLEPINTSGKPLMLVLDTFEEVQYLSGDYVGRLGELLNDLQRIVPRLRVVLSGRAPIPDFPTDELVLDDLDQEAARSLLQALGIPNEELARRVAARVGGNPLSLRLAAKVVMLEGDFSRPRHWLLDRVGTNQIQGVLYRRILDHIHDPDIRKLAHPGLVLRRITPQLIAEVLAEPSGVALGGSGDAERLFHELAREVALVTPMQDGALSHRPDVRRVMLRLLQADQPAAVRELHRRAVDFYQKQEGPVARAEEIYHRLSLDEDPTTLDLRWMPGIEAYLRSAIEELPRHAQAYLTSRLGLDPGRGRSVLREQDQT